LTQIGKLFEVGVIVSIAGVLIGGGVWLAGIGDQREMRQSIGSCSFETHYFK